MKKLFLSLFTAITLSACSTLNTLDEPNFYSGVVADIYSINLCNGVRVANSGSMGCFILVPYAYIDLPFSFVADTALLPVKAVHKLVVE